VVHPSMGICPPTLILLYYLLSSFLHAQSLKILLCKGQDICAHLTRSSFPEIGHNTNPSYNLHKILTSTCTYLCKCSTQHAQSIYNYHLHLAQHHNLDLLPNYLFIHYKKGLNMGKPMGRHPHTRYINPNPKNALKRG
jgi:hypothetical protein